MAKIRAFIACDIPDPLLESISNIQEGLKDLGAEVSWTKVGGVHITLKFLGDIDEASIEHIALVMSEAAGGQPPFEVVIKGIGAFPNLKNPRVVWIGIEDPKNGLSNLQQALDDGLKEFGFEPEERKFRPHLTLGRVKGPKRKEFLSKALSELRDSSIGSFTVDKMMLYRSELKSSGAVYTKLKEIKF